MTDRMLSRGLTLAVVMLETVAGGGALVLLLQAWKDTLAGQFVSAGANVLCGVVAGASVWWLVRNHEALKG